MKWCSLIRSALGLIVVLCSFMLAAPAALADSMPNCPPDMVLIQGGNFRMGSNEFYPEEQSAEDVAVTQFCIGKHEVTNAEFAEFVDTTGYITVAVTAST